MITKTIILLPGAYNVRIGQSSEKCTVLHYHAKPWGPNKLCIYELPGQWEIKSIVKQIVTLINYDEKIQHNGNR